MGFPQSFAVSRPNEKETSLKLHHPASAVPDMLLSQAITERLYTTISLDDLENILQNTEFLYRRESTVTIRFDMNGYKIFAILQGCSDKTRGLGCKAVLLKSNFQLSSNQSSLSIVNEWNRTKRGSRAYLDTNGVIVIEGDIDLFSGVTNSYLRYEIISFLTNVEIFAKYIGIR